ncbi:hypothetical protein BDB00DRAFT_883338 [Zychaea mexicana]|uniref:uncharacterized protein n=1 Tax=Zychaea mexicana TaxID=64656 RepID=UPI0022FE72C8|nr:uncharacterized protein BDB00DRAFT_883338 [Zychaea mexicana]KAI9492808.1 hypothetical protein BDB00DRAFT_883338 [Zychaea mexicana]
MLEAFTTTATATYEQQQRTHLALQLPEIVTNIITHIANSSSHTAATAAVKNDKSNLYQCLFVNRLWQDCASRAIYRTLQFGEHKANYEAFTKFASMFSDEPVLSQQRNLAPYSTPASLANISNNTDYPYTSAFLSRLNDPILDERPQRLNTYRRTLRSLTLRKFKDPTPITQALQQVGKHAVRIERLELYICDSVTDKSVFTFLHHGTLTHLTLAGCYQITDALVTQVAESCPNLSLLDVRACGYVSDKSITQIALRCPKLYHLNVGRVRDRERITNASINLVAQHTNIGVLGLAGCDITDECMLLLATHRNRALERISVNNCRRLTNKSVHAFVKHCRNLVVFEMKECHLVNDWEPVAEMVKRKVLLTLCEQQNRDCVEWAKAHGRTLHVRAPLK